MRFLNTFQCSSCHLRKVKSGHLNIDGDPQRTGGQHRGGWRLNRDARALTGPCGSRNMETVPGYSISYLALTIIRIDFSRQQVSWCGCSDMLTLSSPQSL